MAITISLPLPPDHHNHPFTYILPIPSSDRFLTTHFPLAQICTPFSDQEAEFGPIYA